MTSAATNGSDSDKSDEQSNHSTSEVHSSCQASGMSHPVLVAPPLMPSVAPLPLGTGNPLAQPVYPYPDPYYRSMFAPYDAQSYPAESYPAQPMIHLQFMGIQQAGVPLPSDAVEEPVFVNARQYHGILRRRQSRAKAELENKNAKSRKPYLHESRHLHALRRERGSGGRFLNSKKKEDKPEVEKSNKQQPSGDLNMERRSS